MSVAGPRADRAPALRELRRDRERIHLGNAGTRLVERGTRGEKVREHADSMRAFVALAERSRALFAAGFEEVVAIGGPREVALDDYASLERYASAVDPSRSLPQQELVVASAITPSRARRDARFAIAAAMLTLIGWPATFDATALLDDLDDAERALHEVLARELRSSRRYPKELVRLACKHGSAATLTLALRALERTRDPDAWLDVLIEGEPFLERSHVPALDALAKRAPTRDVARMAREIVRDLKAPPRRRRR